MYRRRVVASVSSGLAIIGLLVCAGAAQARLVAYVSTSCDQGGGPPRLYRQTECPPSIWVANVDGSAARRVTMGASDGDGDQNPVWSPDGSRIAYERQVPGVSGNRSRVWSVRVDGSDPVALTRGEGAYSDLGPVYSPDGRQVAFTTTRFDQYHGNTQTAVMVVNSDGTGEHAVSDTIGMAANPSWSPDGQRILYSEAAAGPTPTWTDLYSVATDGSDLSITADGASQMLSGAAFSPDGRFMTWETASLSPAMADLVSGKTESLGPPGIILDRFELDAPGTTRAGGEFRYGGRQFVHYYDIDLLAPGHPHVRLPDGMPQGPQQPTAPPQTQPDPAPIVLSYVDPYPPYHDGLPPEDPWAPPGATSRATIGLRATLRAGGRSQLAYTALAFAGLRSVSYSLAWRRGNGRCAYFTGRRFLIRDRCGRVHLRRIAGAAAWAQATAHLPHGTYELHFRAVDQRGQASRRRRARILHL